LRLPSAPRYRAVLASLALMAGACGPGAGSPPNIVVLLVDDLGFMDTGSYGSTFYETPHIDRLAETGMRFTQAYAASPVCSPTRAALLTGRHPARLGVTDWLPGPEQTLPRRLRAPEARGLGPGETLVAEVLKGAGYSTAFIGKWHVGGSPGEPERHGFDTNLMFPYSFPESDSPPEETPTSAGRRSARSITDRLTDQALAFLEGNRERPFFLYLSHQAVHTPPEGPEKVVRHFRRKARALLDAPGRVPTFVLEENPDIPLRERLSYEQRVALAPQEGAGEQEYALHVEPRADGSHPRVVRVRQVQSHPVYAAMISVLDDSVGRILAKLEALGLSDRTIIVFTSDNGGNASPLANGTGNWPLRGGKGWLYEGGIRVPLIIRWPGSVRPGSVSAALVTSSDLFPTLLQMAGLDLRPDLHRDGLSLLPVLQETGDLPREALFWHWPHYSNNGEQSPAGAIRLGDHKLIEYFEAGHVQLFDLSSDIGEQNDLSERMPGQAEQLRERLTRWRREIGAIVPTPGAAPGS